MAPSARSQRWAVVRATAEAALARPVEKRAACIDDACGADAELRADALAHPIEPVTPWVEERGGEQFITIPSHLGFPVTQERLDGLWRG